MITRSVIADMFLTFIASLIVAIVFGVWAFAAMAFGAIATDMFLNKTTLGYRVKMWVVRKVLG